jgi:cell division protein FtsW
MSAAAETVLRRDAFSILPQTDYRLLTAILMLAMIGLIMVTSASISLAERNLGTPFYYLERQSLFLLIAFAVGWLILQVRLDIWQSMGTLGLVLAMGLLVLVLVPGVGREVNGSVRWINLGIFNLQVSEVLKVAVMVYLAAYMVRRGEQVRRTMGGFLIPIGLLGVCSVLLLQQPDFGAVIVIGCTGLGMLFLGGVPLWRFAVLVTAAAGGAWALIIGSPYRLERLLSFSNPWADPFNTGFQLTQSLIAIGRGEWFGVGLGGSVQKLFYLPEAHTDFVFAVLAEEFGLIGVVLLIALYSYICWRIFAIGYANMRAGHSFAAYLCWGVAIWFGLQSFINVAVNMGLVPTKGLTLPLLSYGGSSLLMTIAALALVLRAEHERLAAEVSVKPRRGRTA